VNTLKSLREQSEKCRELTCGVILPHNNVPVPKSKLVHAAILQQGYHKINHPPHDADLARRDYFPYRFLKKHLHRVDVQMTQTFMAGRTRYQFLPS